MNNKIIEQGFIRQRRSLILISIVTVIVVGFGIRGTEVRLGPGGGTGITVDILDRRYFYLALYVMWLWFFFRYFQYFSQVRAAARAHLYGSQEIRLTKYFSRLLLAEASSVLMQKARSEHSHADSVDAKIARNPRNITRVNWRSVTADVAGMPIWELHGRTNEGSRFDFSVTISTLKSYPRLLWAIAPINFKHPYFTEYWFPLAIALLPLIALGLCWENVIAIPKPVSSLRW